MLLLTEVGLSNLAIAIGGLICVFIFMLCIILAIKIAPYIIQLFKRKNDNDK